MNDECIESLLAALKEDEQRLAALLEDTASDETLNRLLEEIRADNSRLAQLLEALTHGAQ